MPRLLDLFCGAGGAAMGYHLAGFEVVGVDIKPQPNYPFTFVQRDALEYLRDGISGFDVIHASPPCQAYSSLGSMWPDREHPDLVGVTREALHATGLPWVIENVEGAPLRNAVTLCGSMFQLGVWSEGTFAWLRRHRLFEMSSGPFWAPECQHPAGPVIGVYGGSGGSSRRDTNTQHYNVAERRVAMGIDWMTGAELNQAIPPLYTQWIGARLMEWRGLKASA